MSRVHRASVNMLSSALGYIVPMLVSLVATPYLLRNLGTTAFGLQALVSVVIGYFSIMDMGMEIPIVKLLSEQRGGKETDASSRLLGTTLSLYAAIGIVGMVSIWLCASWLAQGLFKVPADMLDESITVFRLTGIGFLGSMGMCWGRALAMGLQRFDLAYGVFVTLNVMTVGTGLLMVKCGFGVTGYVGVRAFVPLAAMPVYWLLATRVLPGLKLSWKMESSTLRRVLEYIGYGAINRTVGCLVSRLDQTLIGSWVGLAAAGIYSVPFLVVNSLASMVSYSLTFIFPLASELTKGGKSELLRGIFVKASRFAAALAGMIFVPLFVLGDSLLALWVPTISVESTTVLRLLSVALYVSTLCTAVAHGVVLGTGRIRQFTIYATIKNTVMAMACFILIKRFGVTGAGMAAMTTSAVDIVYFMFVVVKVLQFRLLSFFIAAYVQPILLSLAAGALCAILHAHIYSWPTLIGFVGLVEVLFIAVAYTLKIFGETEKRAVFGLCGTLVRRRKHA